MTETRKEVRTCHECGLEAIDACETQNKHLPFDENRPPCCFCVRNSHRPIVSLIADFYDEAWILDCGTPTIEDPENPHERELLEILQKAIKGR